jgi:hypothetical protein
MNCGHLQQSGSINRQTVHWIKRSCADHNEQSILILENHMRLIGLAPQNATAITASSAVVLASRCTTAK